MSTPTITRARPVHAGHMHVAYELIAAEIRAEVR